MVYTWFTYFRIKIFQVLANELFKCTKIKTGFTPFYNHTPEFLSCANTTWMTIYSSDDIQSLRSNDLITNGQLT